MKQPAVSRCVQALEDELGVSLFERSPSGARPTIAGERFFERVRVELWEINQAVENAAAAGRGVQGLLRIGVLPSFFPSFLGDLLIEFRANQPEATVELFDGSLREFGARTMAQCETLSLEIPDIADAETVASVEGDRSVRLYERLTLCWGRRAKGVEESVSSYLYARAGKVVAAWRRNCWPNFVSHCFYRLVAEEGFEPPTQGL